MSSEPHDRLIDELRDAFDRLPGGARIIVEDEHGWRYELTRHRVQQARPAAHRDPDTSRVRFGKP